MNQAMSNVLRDALGPRGYKWAAWAFRPVRQRLSRHRLRPPGPELALRWLRRQKWPVEHAGGHGGRLDAVAGAAPTLLQYGERALAAHLAQHLISVQKPDGSYPAADLEATMRNTVHALGGLLATEAVNSEGRDAAMRAADYLFRRMKEFSNVHLPEPKTRTTLLLALASLKRAGGLLDRPEYESRVEEWLDHRQSWAGVTAVERTYLLAHQCAALIDLGRHEMASHILDALRDRQMDDGSVLAGSGQSSVCMAGLGHLASCWDEVGNWQSAEKALAWMERQQLKTGAFPGRYGREIHTQARVESVLAAKFYLDANRLRVISYMARIADILPAEIDADDGRVQAVMELVRPGDRVLEVGCGKGRFLKRICERYPDAECIGVDICPRLLEELPAGIRGVEGSLEAIPFPDNNFDLVFSVEAIEHSSNREAAVREMARVARAGGWVVIIDKQKSHWGRLACPAWESWPDSRGLMRLLRAECLDVARKAVSYNHCSPDGLMIAWRGRKRQPVQ